MRQMIFDGPGRLHWEDTASPGIADPDSAVVRPIAVATCDLDTAILRGTVPWFVGPYPFGHEAVAEVVEVGDAVRTVRRGDVVAVPFQISCGSCARCATGHTSHCERHRGVHDYGLGPVAGSWPGLLADLAPVPHADAMLVPVPPGVSPREAASISDNLPDAFRTVAPVEDYDEPDVLIVAGGAPSIGLYAISMARTLGAAAVTYVDDDEGRLRIAEGLGAQVVEGRPDRMSRRYTVTVDASARPDGLALALRSTGVGGTCTSVGIYWDPPQIPFLEMYSTGVTFRTGVVSARPAMPRILGMIAVGTFDPALPLTEYVEWEAAVDALQDPADKTIVHRP